MTSVRTSGALDKTREFWNASPCDGRDSLEPRRRWRYAKDPWIPSVIAAIAARHQHVVEIGCGQGTDGLTFCQVLPATASYLGLDYSPESVEAAERAAQEATGLAVTPRFVTGNAEYLDLEPASVECVYSFGVLHHTPDTVGAVREVHRVLKPGGRAYVFLYNRRSPKVLAAHALRWVQSALDAVFGTDRLVYRALYGRHLEGSLGTALLEGFGVPVLRSYTHAGIKNLFTDFHIVSAMGCGINLPTAFAGTQSTDLVERRNGLFWFVTVEKA